MSYRALLDGQQRLAICQVLEQDPDYSHNEQVIKAALGMTGHHIGSDLVRNHLNWLAEQGLITIDKDSVPSLWIARLTSRGEDAALGHALFEGVARPRPL
jgi:repressor of nif and glnA expression